jgi:signal transduction histidine kinase
MNWPYHYTPYLWPALASTALMAGLSLYGWRRRRVPGALWFAVLMALWSLSTIGTALQITAVELPAKIFWYKFQFFWAGPNTVAGLCFVLAYARLNRFLTRRTLSLLFMVILLGSLLLLTNEAHHRVWTGFSYFDGRVYPLREAGYWVLVVIGYFLAFLNLPILVWLFIRSPLHRWPAALILSGQVAVRAAILLMAAGPTVLAPFHPVVLAATFQAVVFAIALFGFRIFDPIQMARNQVTKQMREGMLVLDSARKIVELNPAAEKILGRPGAHLRGRDAAEFLPVSATQSAPPDDKGIAQTGVSLGAHDYDLRLSPIKDWDGQLLGHLLLMHDVTEQKQAQAQLVEQQRALAMLSERERLARELHDNIGQVLGFAGLQVETVRKLLEGGQTAEAGKLLTRLAGVLQEGHADVREDILNLRIAPSAQRPLFAALRQYLDGVSQNYGLQTELNTEPDLDEAVFQSEAQMQLFRIVQEAVSNARRHGGARRVQVIVERQDSRARLVIRDDGCGFDPRQPVSEGGSHFGLQFMRERAEGLGGCLSVESASGAGTTILVEIPIQGGGS